MEDQWQQEMSVYEVCLLFQHLWSKGFLKWSVFRKKTK
jgi:hypothetical protein